MEDPERLDTTENSMAGPPFFAEWQAPQQINIFHQCAGMGWAENVCFKKPFMLIPVMQRVTHVVLDGIYELENCCVAYSRKRLYLI